MPMPLEGLRVLDWTIWQQGPVCSAMLGDMGAEVIKIESRDGGDPGRGLAAIGGGDLSARPNFYFEANNRNKQSITLDLKQPEAREIVHRLAAVSDVFVQNYRKGVAARLELDYASLRRHNERLIYANATGYGPNGPDSADPSFDQLGLARSGIMLAAGEPDMMPLAIAGGIADQMGAVMLAYGVMTALVARERHGLGQEVDASHLGSMSFLQGLSLSCKLMAGFAFRARSGHAPGTPCGTTTAAATIAGWRSACFSRIATGATCAGHSGVRSWPTTSVSRTRPSGAPMARPASPSSTRSSCSVRATSGSGSCARAVTSSSRS